MKKVIAVGVEYHAIAHIMNWGDRGRLWAAAGLPDVVTGRCLCEPNSCRPTEGRTSSTQGIPQPAD